MKNLSTTTAALQSNPFARWMAITIWLVVALLCIGLFFVDLVNDYSQIQIPCEGAWTIDGGCNFLAISSAEAEVLASWGLTMQHYALAMLAPTVMMVLIYSSLGFLILWRQGRSVIGLTVSLALLIIPFSIHSSEVDWATIDQNLFLPGVIASIVSNIISILFFFLIPNGRFSPRKAYIVLIPGLLVISLLIIHINNIVILPDTIIDVFIILVVILVALGIIFQIYRYFRDSSVEERQQSKWILSGVVTSFISVFVWLIIFGGAMMIPGGQIRLLVNIGFMYIINTMLSTLPVAITFAILRYNLWNIDIAINRSLVGAIVTVVLALVFAAGIVLVQNVLRAENPMIGFAISAIGPAILFNPTRKRVRHFIDRRVYGLAFDLNELNAAGREQQILSPGALSGATLDEYTVLDVIGKGGMGEVYKGQSNGQLVAIKTMLPEIAKDPTMRSRFMREAEIGQTLDHPAIAKVYAGGDFKGTPYLVMEYIDGEDIREQLKSGETYDTETATSIMTQICEALDMAHARGYVHRDIKPANIMLRENGSAVLMDFGVTKVGDASVALTGTGAVGTISYMAPEQIKASRDVDHRADIYALGIMLYEMLTGQQPFTGGAAQILFAHLQQPAPDPRDIDDTIPGNIADAILVALEKEPDKRFQSAGEFAMAFNAQN